MWADSASLPPAGAHSQVRRFPHAGGAEASGLLPRLAEPLCREPKPAYRLGGPYLSVVFQLASGIQRSFVTLLVLSALRFAGVSCRTGRRNFPSLSRRLQPVLLRASAIISGLRTASAMRVANRRTARSDRRCGDVYSIPSGEHWCNHCDYGMPSRLASARQSLL